MSFFKKSGPSSDEIAREVYIKKTITEAFGLALKSLQSEYVNQDGDQTVYSDDAANHLCNIIEAVFLHGIKTNPKMTKKFSDFIKVPDIGKDPSLHYWKFVRKFTHSNVLMQLTRLAQVTTDIGLCRAWVRFALNDGVLESYVVAILADKKALERYYKETAYLRDIEQPEILKMYIHGVSNMKFQLSYNSSALNMWSATPLVYAGLREAQVMPDTSAKLPVEQVEHEKISYWSQEDINTLSNPATSGSAANLITARNVHIDANENATTDSTTTEPTAAKVNSFDGSSSSTSSVGKKAPTDAEIEDDPNAVVPHNTQLDGECILSSEEADMIRSLSISRKREHAEQADGSPSTATSCVSKPDFGDERVNIWKNALERRMSNSSESGTSSGKKKRKSICSVDGAHANRKSSVRNVVILDNNEEIEKNLASTRLKASVATNKTVEESMPKKGVEKMRRRHKSSTSTDSGEGGIELTFNKTSEARDGRAIEEDAIDVTAGAIAATAERNDVESSTKKLTGNSKAMSGKKHPGNREKSGRKRSGDKQKSTKKVPGGQKSHDDPEKSPVRTRHLSSSAPKCSTSPIHTVNKIPKSSRRPSLKLTTAASSPLLQSTDKPLSPVPCSDTDIPFLTDFNNSTSGASRDRQGSENRARIRTLSSDLVESNSEDLTPSEDEDYAVYGNSLGALGGWSSSFDNGVADLLAQRKQEVEREKLKEQERKQEMFEESVHAESFTRMLMELHKPTHSGDDDDEVSDGLLESLPSDSSAAAKDNSGSTDGSSTSDFVCVPSQTTDKEENAKVDSFLAKIKTICKEEGLLQQNYKCAGCQRPIGMIFNKARVCGYDALYYCYECHENDEHYVPARVLYNWDFTKYKVAKTNLQLLMDHSAQPLFDVQELNPRLYEHIPEMKETQDLRTQLGYLKTYLFSCNQDVFEDFKQQIWPSDYLYESLHLYSIQDFLLIYQRQMATKLQKVVKWGIAHVLGCRLCSQQGYVCEICKDPRVIYPFQMDNMYRCPHCTAMYHMSCKETFVSCPKCARRIHYRELSMSASDDTDD